MPWKYRKTIGPSICRPVNSRAGQFKGWSIRRKKTRSPTKWLETEIRQSIFKNLQFPNWPVRKCMLVCRQIVPQETYLFKVKSASTNAFNPLDDPQIRILPVDQKPTPAAIQKCGLTEAADSYNVHRYIQALQSTGNNRLHNLTTD